MSRLITSFFLLVPSLLFVSSVAIGQTQESTGDCSPNIGNVSGDVKVNQKCTFNRVVTGVNLTDLIATLTRRAEKIKKFLQDNHPDEKHILIQFDTLHKEHITHLKAGNVIAAHDTLLEIHSLSYELFVKNDNGAYCRQEPIPVRGVLVNAYVVGMFDNSSDRYPTPADSIIKGVYVMRSVEACSTPHEMAKAFPPNSIYNLVLD